MNLDEWRSRINNLDDEILKLLNQRGTAALRIGELKRQQDLPYFSPEREAQVLERLVALNDGPLGPDAIRVIWREILSASLALEHPLPVAYLGPPGTFTHQAATRRFGSSAQLLPVHTIAEIFDEVERGRAEYGVVPVENSTEGAVNVTLDRLIDSDVTITGEMTLDISQHLISRATDLAGVKVVCSHPQGLAQCRAWLAAHLPEAATEETASTSGAVERARDDATVAAVASDMAAQVHGVPILRPRIEDNKNEPGVLYSILQPFATRGLNLTKIESRPTKRRPWEYVNFLDFEGHCETANVRDVLAEVRERCQFLKVLGSYPAV